MGRETNGDTVINIASTRDGDWRIRLGVRPES